MRIRNLLLHLAINHEVMPEMKEKDGKKELFYSASSPDEGALVYGARHFGFEFKERDPSGILIALDDGTLVKVRILAILEFNSRRKRSSVICQFQDKTPDGNTKEGS
jgi:magnesium-transporting ATPase (P-type)